MKRINILNEETANKIAAGEVVERPSSVVKELVENSIDAKAKNILIEIENGGTTLIKIVDDGEGIYKDDIKTAFLPHATSKIKDSEDIYSINTLGFRGEALPSIASVSKINLKTKSKDEEFGYELNIEGGTFDEIKECGINKGTMIEVKDLFFNVPARKKFLKSDGKEGSLINDIITRIALANPDISFKLYNNHKKIIHTYGNGKLKDTIRTIYGKTIDENIIYFEQPQDKVTVYGYVGKEEIARGSRNNQSIFVNKRYVKNKSLAVAVEQAFKSFSTCSKFPFFILFIEIYPEYVDVNIHPTKAEVKFDNEREIFKQIFGAVHTALKNEVFDSFKIDTEEEEKTVDPLPSFEEIQFKINEERQNVKIAQNSCAEKMKEKTEISIPVDLKDHTDKSSYETGKDSDKNVEYENNDNMSLSISNKPQAAYNVNPVYNNDNSFVREDSAENHTYTDINDNETISEPIAGLSEENSKAQGSSDINAAHNSNETSECKREAKFPPLTIIGQYNKTYILGEYDGTLYMIDQHAAHEKINFERYKKDIENNTIVIQPLMVPSVIDLTIDDYSYFEDNKDVFRDAGFTLEEFGGNTVALKEVPYFLGKLDPKKLFLEILDNLKNLGNGKTTEVKHNAIATKACKASIKGNDYLEMDEMIKLVEDLRYIDDPFHCPHGRPVIIKFTSYDIDKKFRRIV